MKTNTFTLVMILTLSVTFINAYSSVWRVNPTPNSSAHYATAQAAHDAATTLTNDTLYLEGSTYAYGGLSITKKLTIIGTGYYLDQNPETQYNTQPSIFSNYVYCYAGCEGSKFIGCTFQYSVYLYASNITFERNNFMYGNNYSLYAYANCSNIQIINNYFENYYGYFSIYFPYVHSNILISNNYINGGVATTSSFNGVFANNIFYYAITIYNSTLVNNVALSTVALYNCISTYNIGNSTQFGNTNGNQQNVPAVDLFVGATGNSTDGQWQLKAGSPALGAGENGVDIGMYGGNYPYKLSGLPPIPTIYNLEAESLPSNTLNVSLNAKSHN